MTTGVKFKARAIGNDIFRTERELVNDTSTQQQRVG